MSRRSQPYNQYRRIRQRESVTLAELAAESDVDKQVLLNWEVGRARLLHSDTRRIFLALKSLVRRRAIRSRRREIVPGRSQLRPKPLAPPVSFANLGKVSQ